MGTWDSSLPYLVSKSLAMRFLSMLPSISLIAAFRPQGASAHHWGCFETSAKILTLVGPLGVTHCHGTLQDRNPLWILVEDSFNILYRCMLAGVSDRPITMSSGSMPYLPPKASPF